MYTCLIVAYLHADGMAFQVKPYRYPKPMVAQQLLAIARKRHKHSLAFLIESEQKVVASLVKKQIIYYTVIACHRLDATYITNLHGLRQCYIKRQPKKLFVLYLIIPKYTIRRALIYRLL